MPFLSVAGIELKVEDFAEASSELVGVEKRSWSGAHRAAVDGEIRTWTGMAVEMTKAQYEALRAATRLAQHVTVNGDAMPTGGRTCVVTLANRTYIRDRAGFLIDVAFTASTVDPE